MALGKPLVNPKWVDDCKQLNRLVKVCSTQQYLDTVCTVVKCLTARMQTCMHAYRQGEARTCRLK